MFGPDVLVPKTVGLFRGELQGAIGFIAERDLDGRIDPLACPGPALDIATEVVDRYSTRRKDLGGNAGGLARDPQQKVFDCDLEVAELGRSVQMT